LDAGSDPYISITEKYLNYRFEGKKVLIVGGGLYVKLPEMFFKKGADVYVIEPDEDRIDVQFLYAALIGIPESRIIKSFAENLPFESNTFDFVHCVTVLEHVQDVKKSLLEMYRVAKNGGVVFIETPDFRIPYEPHYKIVFPYYLSGMTYLYACLPARIRKFIVKLGLILLHRPTKFHNSINFLSEKYLKRLFLDNKWRYLQLHFNPAKDNGIYYKF
jgi:ubiquinone/menaquinone biosynthesis C-methylase UbiE